MSAVPGTDSPLSQRLRPMPDTLRSGSIASGTDGAASERRVVNRTASGSSTQVDPALGTPSRSSTLRKNNSLHKRASLSRRSSKRSLRAGAVRGVGDDDEEGYNNVLNIPIPTQGNPTEVLANRFLAWRKLLKDLVTYFREIQSSYENRSKALLKVSNVLNNTHTPNGFLSQAGLDEAITTLRGFHKISLTESNKSKDIEDDVITQLNGLRSDLNQKIKEIKSLSGDFKNSVEKERDATRRAVEHLKDVLAAAEADPSAASGKNDPFIVRLAVERQVERQIEEENYLHRAYLNLEGSGRELESIVVGEIQKAYNAYAGILRRETDNNQQTIDDLRAGPIAMPKDHEWAHFVEHDTHFVNPNLPIRRLEDIYFPGKFSAAASEIRGGMLERKSKYLKSYTPGWYVMSATHLHEFKSADHIHTQQPVMSLYLLDQRLGSHSQTGAGSHKFSLKGKQTGGMHRGHSWVFRAESYDTMMAWYEDIRILTERPAVEREAFVRRHARSVSGGSSRAPASVSSDGLDEDEADAEPFAANAAVQQSAFTPPPKRPEPGGRFPSDINVNRTLNPTSSSGSSQDRGDSIIPADVPMTSSTVTSTGNAVQQLQPPPVIVAATTVASTSATTPKKSDFAQTQTPEQVPEQNAGQAVVAPASSKSLPKANASPRELDAQQMSGATPAHNSTFVNPPPTEQPITPASKTTNIVDKSVPMLGGAAASGAITAAAIEHKKHEEVAPPKESDDLDNDDGEKTPMKSDIGATSHADKSAATESSYFEMRSLSSLSPQSPLSMDHISREPTLPNLDGAVFDDVQAHKQQSQTQARFEPQPVSTDLLSPTSRSITDASSMASDDTIEAPVATTSTSTTTTPKSARLYETGRVFPSVLRHESAASVSELHVPGEFPPPTPVELE